MTTPDTATLDRLDRQHFLHPFTSLQEQAAQGPMIIDSGSGTRLRDAAGREYLDAMAGLWCVNAGYGRRELAEAIAAQAQKLSYYHAFMGMASEPAIRLAAKLAEIAPGALNHVFFANSGSEANDTQVKLVWYYNNVLGRPNKKKIIARTNGYHGVTVASATLSGLPHLHNGWDVPRPWVIHVEKPHYYWNAKPGMTELEYSAHLARGLEAAIAEHGADNIAAFIAEPIMGAGGVIAPPAGYFEAIVPILRAHDILLIADEVVCGFGRLGQWFGSQYYGFDPDLMTVAKGLTSGYVPMSACLVGDAVFEVLREGSAKYGQFNHGFTYSAHPLAAAAGVANLALMEREGLVANAATVGAYLHRRLRETVAPHPLAGEVRGTVMIAAIELVADRNAKQAFDLKLGVAKRLYNLLMADGLLMRPIGNAVCMSPPLILTESEVDEIVGKISAGLERLAADLAREGVWKA